MSQADATGTGATVSARVVVGIDGSDGSIAALAWAVDEAARRHTAVRAISAWSYPVAVVAGAVVPAAPFQDQGADALEHLRSTLTAAGGESGSDDTVLVNGVVVVPEVAEGPPAKVLVDASEDADLLVVGARGHGGFLGLLLGSVSQQVSHHARCPLVIVHPPKNAPAK